MNSEKEYLKKLEINDGIEFYNMLQDIEAIENSFSNPVKDMRYNDYRDWLCQQVSWSEGKDLPPGFVPQNVYWLMVGNTPVGIGKIRHELTTHSRQIGGNIGYAISKKFRGEGLGTQLLSLLIIEAKAMNIKELLLTVDKFNYASKKVIENNKGILFNENDERWYFHIK